MKRDKEYTKVIFKMAKYAGHQGEEVLAFFPGASANPGNIMSYAHVGQHGEACEDLLRISVHYSYFNPLFLVVIVITIYTSTKWSFIYNF